MLSNFPFAPPQASNFAAGYDTLFYAILGMSLLFFVATFFFVIYYALKFREGSKADRSSPMYENARLEALWIGAPTVLGLIFFVWAADLYGDMRTPPKDAKEIYVIGKQWMWHVQHPDGTRENNTIHVPMGKPVKLTMISQDVIHAVYIPAFRVQYMVNPGRYTQLWFTATQEGTYPLFCNMYCGTQHSEMGGKVIVMKPKDYADWLASNGTGTRNLSASQAGERLFANLGCGTCHGEKDQPPIGPTLRGLYGSTRTTADGKKWIADESYIRESLLRPYEKVTKGYTVSMGSYKELSNEDVINLIEYIKAGAVPSGAAPELAPAAPMQTSSVNGKMGLNSNALEYNAPDADITPTRRSNGPAVGAIAAEKK